jgi:glycosyltransferase involved in cell wall biosynthesis
MNPAHGGPMEGIRQITPHLAQLGVQTTVACLDHPDSAWLQGQSFFSVGFGPVSSGYAYIRGLPSKILELANLHDIVIIHGIWQYHSLAAWRALHNTPIPYFVYPHGMLDPWFKRTYPIKHLKKSIYWPWADYRVLRDANAVFFTTEQERLLARQSFRRYQANECVIGYGTSSAPSANDVKPDLFFQSFPELQGRRILIFLGRIHPKKGIDLLIQAFSEVACCDPRLHLVIVGPDQIGWKHNLQQLAASLSVDNRITWTGMLSGDLKWAAYRAAELFCLPSHQENFGIAVAEALACGLPVMISDSVNISIEVAKVGAGLVHHDNQRSTTEGLRRWVSMPQKYQVLMGHRAHQLFVSQFDLASVSHQLHERMQLALHPSSM